MPLPKLPSLVTRPPIPAPAPVAAPATPADVPAAPEEPRVPVIDDAALLLRKASDRTGLGDLELARIARYEAMLKRGEREAAIEGLALLNAELDGAARTVAISSGENLRAFAGRTDVYGNAAMWPLIWRANLDALPEAWQVHAGQNLAVPSFPALSEVAESIAYAQSHPKDVVRPDSR